MRRSISLTYLSEKKGQIRERQTHRGRYSERDSFERKKQLQIIEREKKERENHCDFCIPTRERFLDCNCGFVHRWIRLMFGQQVVHTSYLERDKCFAFSVLYFGSFIFLSLLYQLEVYFTFFFVSACVFQFFFALQKCVFQFNLSLVNTHIFHEQGMIN